MTEQEPARDAAVAMYERLGDHTEDILDEACAETWPGGEDEWWAQDGPQSGFEAHREATFRQAMAELAATCLERSLGRYNGSNVESA